MTQEELIELLNAHEWRDVEFKEAQRDVPRNAYETVSAFANTDGGHLVAAGVPTIGFGPAEAHTLHTVREHVPVDMLAEGMLGYIALALELGRREE